MARDSFGFIPAKKIERCSPGVWCDDMILALQQTARNVLYEAQSFELESMKYVGITIALRCSKGKTYPLHFCPWCRGPLAETSGDPDLV